MKALIGAAIVVLAALLATPSLAQDVEIEATTPAAPERAPRVIPPGLRYETTRPSDTDDYPGGTRVRHDPAFIQPFGGRWQSASSSGRVGLSGWTAPSTPVGPVVAGYQEVPGWFALGFSVTWGGPPAPARPAR